MKKIYVSVLFFLILLIIPLKSITTVNPSLSLYTSNKFFVKTNQELKISEATGKISMQTGIITLDEKIKKYDIVSIEKQFNLNNGDPELFQKYGMERIYLFYINENKKSDIEKIIKDFTSDQSVEFSEPNFMGTSAGVKEKIESEIIFKSEIPNDEYFSRQWYLKNIGSVNPSSGGIAKVGADINMLKAWAIEEGSEEVIIAILDSGIKDTHPDLRNRMWINKGEIPNNGIDDDRNGYIDDYKGWDFAYDDNKPDDGFGHGTNIATVIGASVNNKIGYAGVDQNAKLMNCKNLNSGNNGEYSWWAESIKYAVDNGADIINMSEGGDDYSRVLETAIKYAQDRGALIVAAMMNKGDDRDYYPASLKGVMAVGATDTDDNRCRRFSWGGGSCYGKHISVVAPGNKIYGLDHENDFNFDVYWSGTSQSTAIVSGLAAMLLSQKPTRTSKDLQRIIKLSAKDQVGNPREDKPGWDKYYGYGRVDSYAAFTFERTSEIDRRILQLEKNETPEIEDARESTEKNPARSLEPRSNKPAILNEEDDDKRARKR
jgi:thermitase